MRVALTGGTGFVGANLVRALLRRGDEVHLLNRSSFTCWRIESVRKDVHVHVVDLADAAGTRAALDAARPDLVFHLAQHGGYAWQVDAREMIATNYLAGINLLYAVKDVGARLFVNTGSSSEYGAKPHATSESTVLEPNSDYAATKAAFTLHCQHWARREQRPARTLRLYSVYGPFEEPQRLIPRLLSFGLEGKLPPLAAPDTARDFVFVGDVVDACLRAADAALTDPGSIHNVCTGRQVTLSEAVETAQQALGFSAEPQWGTIAGRAWDTSVWVGDPARAARELGWRPKMTLEAGLRSFADWLEQERDMGAFYRARRALQ
jgi:UDP-glucose 4-epimerase